MAKAEIGDNFADPIRRRSTMWRSTTIDLDDKEIALKARHGHALDDQERLVVQERWLTDEVAPLELLGEFLGISPGRVKRIEIGALAKLQVAAATSIATT